MTLLVITPPGPVVTLDQAKRQLRVEHDDDDDLIDALVGTATATLDGPDGWLGRALGEQVLELQVRSFGCWLGLPFPPIVSVSAVTYLDPTGAMQTVAPELYFLEAGRFVRSVPAWAPPALACRSDAVRVRYVAGHPDTPAAGDVPAKSTVPLPIRQAILMMVTRLYAGRGEMVASDLFEDPAIDALLAPYRVWA